MAAGVGASLLGNIAGGILGKTVSSAMDLNASRQLIEKQLEAQKDLFSYENLNKHQFEVSDLKAAGLNPILSATNGQAIGVGGVSAPNWSSDDDVYGPASARAMQQENLRIQDSLAKSSLVNAEANMLKAKTGYDQMNRDMKIKEDKFEFDVAEIVSKTLLNNKQARLAEGKFSEAISNVGVNNQLAIKYFEEASGKHLDNQEEKFVLEMINSPDLKDTPTRTALILAKKLNLPTSERVGLVAAITGHKFRSKQEINDRSYSARSVDDFDEVLSKFDLID